MLYNKENINDIKITEEQYSKSILITKNKELENTIQQLQLKIESITNTRALAEQNIQYCSY